MKLMKLINRFIQERPVGVFFLVVFAIPWLPSFFVVGPKFFRGEVIEFSDIMMIGLAMFAAPILSGILIAFIVDGKAGIGDMGIVSEDHVVHQKLNSISLNFF